MHVPQLMLVEGSSAENAMEYVDSMLSDFPASPVWWSSQVIGGRFENKFLGFSEHLHALRYSENPALADDLIAEAVRDRFARLTSLVSDTHAKGQVDVRVLAEEYDPFDEFHLKSETYDLRGALRIIGGEWNSDSNIYDMHESSTNLKYIKERIVSNPEEQFLVIVDFTI